MVGLGASAADQQLAAVELEAVQHSDGLRDVFRVGQLHERVSSGASGRGVLDDADVHQGAEALEQGREAVFRGQIGRASCRERV
jgi:hypothetical protein